MSQNEFVVFLPSNVISKSSHENTVAHYVTKLPHPLELNEHWEVAVSEIMVPGVASLQLSMLQESSDLKPYMHGNHLVIGVWTNIVRPSHFGSGDQRLLRKVAIEVRPTQSGVSHLEFDQLHFYPISLTIIREIEVKFLLPTGRLVPFEPKRSQIVLIFRKKQNSSK